MRKLEFSAAVPVGWEKLEFTVLPSEARTYLIKIWG